MTFLSVVVGVFCTFGRSVLLLSDTGVDVPLSSGRFGSVVVVVIVFVVGKHSATTTAVPHAGPTATATAAEHVETIGGGPDERFVGGCAVGPGPPGRRLLIHMVATGLRSRRHTVPEKVCIIYLFRPYSFNR